MNIALHTTVEEIDAAAWAALKPRPRGSRAWFRTSERYFTDTRHRYLAASEQGELKAILPLFDRFDPAYFNVTEYFQPLARRALERQRFWAIGSRLGFDAEVIGAAALTGPLLDAATAFAEEDGADFVAVNFSAAPLSEWNDHLLGPVFDKYVIRWNAATHEEYLTEIGSRGRKLFKQDARGGEAGFLSTLEGNAARFNALRTVSCERQGAENHLTDEFFEIMAEEMGDALVVVASGSEAEWSGACLMISSEAEFCGFSIGVRERDRTYFNLLIHEPIKIAVESGRRSLDVGAACDVGKKVRGGQPIPLTCYLRPISRKCALAVHGVQAVECFARRVSRRVIRSSPVARSDAAS